MTPTPPVDRERLARRLSLTLTGLPPSLALVDEFQSDTSPDAGGGVRGGQVIGQTDPVGYSPVERPILHPQNLHATLLHALGVDQFRLTYEHQNRQELATVLGAEVVREAFTG